MKGATALQLMAFRNFQIPEPCVTSPHKTIRRAFCCGVMMCSHTPDTTRPMAKPDTPEVRPPRKVAARKKAKLKPSILVAPKNKVAALGWISSDGEAAWSPNFAEVFLRLLAQKQHKSPP